MDISKGKNVYNPIVFLSISYFKSLDTTIKKTSTIHISNENSLSLSKSLNFSGRKHELNRINFENDRIAKRLMKMLKKNALKPLIIMINK